MSNFKAWQKQLNCSCERQRGRKYCIKKHSEFGPKFLLPPTAYKTSNIIYCCAVTSHKYHCFTGHGRRQTTFHSSSDEFIVPAQISFTLECLRLSGLLAPCHHAGAVTGPITTLFYSLFFPFMHTALHFYALSGHQ